MECKKMGLCNTNKGRKTSPVVKMCRAVSVVFAFYAVVWSHKRDNNGDIHYKITFFSVREWNSNRPNWEVVPGLVFGTDFSTEKIQLQKWVKTHTCEKKIPVLWWCYKRGSVNSLSSYPRKSLGKCRWWVLRWTEARIMYNDSLIISFRAGVSENLL